MSGKANPDATIPGGGSAVLQQAGQQKACQEKGGHARLESTKYRGGDKAIIQMAGQQPAGLVIAGRAKLKCPLCKITVTDVNSMRIHYEDCHPMIPFDESEFNR